MNTGGSAFPVADFDKSGNTRTSSIKGMHLRDYFAAAALQAIISKPTPANTVGMRTADSIAAVAYKYADAMVAARLKDDLPDQE